MGTNYFMLTNRCDRCGRADELHIGKSSIGWRFAARAYVGIDDDGVDEDGPTTWDEWVTALRSADAISDEYGRPVTADELLEMIGRKAGLEPASDGEFTDGPVDLLPWEFC